MNGQWIEQLRNRISGHKETPPKNLLGDIETEMRRRGIVMFREARAKRNSSSSRRFAVVSAYATAAAAAAIVAAIFLTGGENDTVSPQSPQTPATAHTGRPKRDRHDATVKTGRLLAETGTVAPQCVSYGLPTVETATETATNGDTDIQEGKQSGQPESCNAKETKSKSIQQRKKTTATANSGFAGIAKSKDGGQDAGNISVAAYCSGTMSRQNGNTQGVVLTAANPFGEYSPDMKADEGSTSLWESKSLHVKSHHKQPVKAGISIRYNITPRLGVQTGMEYSYHSSDFDFGNGKNKTSTAHQTLHYIGIPLKMTYSVLRKKRLNIYVAAGGEAEKLVKGKTTTKYLYDPKQPDFTEKVRESRLQFSANAAAGMEYNIAGNVEVYAEPGISHHFNNGSDVENIYKKRPTNLNLSIGLRISLNKNK